jgi:hypothetical protein
MWGIGNWKFLIPGLKFQVSFPYSLLTIAHSLLSPWTFPFSPFFIQYSFSLFDILGEVQRLIFRTCTKCIFIVEGGKYSACSSSHHQQSHLSYFQLSTPSLIRLLISYYRKQGSKHNDCCRALAGYWCGAVSIALNFWRYLFFQETRGKRLTQQRRYI